MTEDEKQAGEGKESGPEEVGFADFVFLQYQQARFSLGQFPNPQTGNYEENLTLAQYSIDVLAMLKRKTQGNLNEHEERLLDNVLHELRLTYVERLHAAAKKKEAAPDTATAESRKSEGTDNSAGESTPQAEQEQNSPEDKEKPE